MEASEKFVYHKQFDPLHDENLNFEWSIELSEMEGTDPLSDSLNQYHRELFEEQKTLMEAHQKEMMEMEPDEIRDRWMSIRFSNNLSTRASFKWGNVFTVVDMENTIRNRRKELGLSQEELARKCGVSRQTVNAIENNKYDPTLALAFSLAKELCVTVDELFIPS